MRHNIENGINNEYVHSPVMWREVFDFIAGSIYRGDGILVDATLGEGGHSEIMLKKIDKLSVIGFERDREILAVAEKRLKHFGERFRAINGNFSKIKDFLNSEKDINYILYDFGISSYHMEKSGRGFAFNTDKELDMRLDGDCKVDAMYIVNNYTEKRLAHIIYTYGEDRWARRIASVICKKRKIKKITTTGELANIVLGAIPKRFHVRNIHPAARVFQALRIEVNNELTAIEESLNDSYKLLKPGGRMMAISFHSLEDRIVKDKFRRLSKGCMCSKEAKYCDCNSEPQVKLLTKKPLRPSEDEVRINRRARSSKLRVCERI